MAEPEEHPDGPPEDEDEAQRGAPAALPRSGSFAVEAPERLPHPVARVFSTAVDELLPQELEPLREEGERQAQVSALLDEAKTWSQAAMPASARVGTAPRKALRMEQKGVALLEEPEQPAQSSRWRTAGRAIVSATRLRALAQAQELPEPPDDDHDLEGTDGADFRHRQVSVETANSLPTSQGFRGLGVLVAARARAAGEGSTSPPLASVAEDEGGERPLHVPPPAPWERQQQASAAPSASEDDDAPPPWAVAAGRAQARGGGDARVQRAAVAAGRAQQRAVNFREDFGDDDAEDLFALPTVPTLSKASQLSEMSTTSEAWDPRRQTSAIVRKRGISVASSLSDDPQSFKSGHVDDDELEVDDLADAQPGSSTFLHGDGAYSQRVMGSIMSRTIRRASTSSSDSRSSDQMKHQEESSSSDDEDAGQQNAPNAREHALQRLTPMQRALIQRRVNDQLGICEDPAEESQGVRVQRALGILQLRSFIMVTKQVVDEEPPRWPAVRDLVRSIRFEMLIGVLIISNGVLIGADTMYGKWEERPAILGVMEHVFTVIFLVEFILRLLAFSWVWVFQPMNAFDTFLILVTGVLVNWVLGPVGVDAGMLQRLSAFRVLRLGRLCRAVRMMPMFHELWMLVQGVMECMSLLFWAAIIISVIHYMFGVAVVEIVAKSETFQDDETTQEMFGDLQKAMYTLFQIMTFDSWASIVRPIIFKMPETIPVFLLFVGIAGFVLFNLMTAIVVKNAFDAASEDEEAVAQMKENDRKRQEQALLEMFDELDTDDSGMLSKQEFAENVLDDMVFIHQLKTLDIELEELPDVFDILDDGDGQVSTEEFCTGLMRMQGNAMSRDMLKATKRAKTVNSNFEAVNNEVEGIAHDVLGRIEESLDDSHNNFVEMQAMCAEVLKSLNLIGLRRAIKAVSNVLPTMEEPDDGAEESLVEQRAKDEIVAQRAVLAKSCPGSYMKPLPAAWIQRRKAKQESRAKTMARKTLTAGEDRDKVHGTPCVAQEFQKQWEDMQVWRPEMTFSESLREEASRMCTPPSLEGNASAGGVRGLPAHLVDKRAPPAQEAPPPPPPPEASEKPAAALWRRERPAGGAVPLPSHPHAVPQCPFGVF